MGVNFDGWLVEAVKPACGLSLCVSLAMFGRILLYIVYTVLQWVEAVSGYLTRTRVMTGERGYYV